jgi:hypothetical protein
MRFEKKAINNKQRALLRQYLTFVQQYKSSFFKEL